MNKAESFNLDHDNVYSDSEVDLGNTMSNSDNSDIEKSDADFQKSYGFEKSYDLTNAYHYSSDSYDYIDTNVETRALIDCDVVPSIALGQIIDDVAGFELEEVNDLKKSFKEYDDVAYWLTALVGLSPTGALLLKTAADYDWNLAFSGGEQDGWALNADDFIATLNHAQVQPKALMRSPYFLNTLVCDFIHALRDIWLEENNTLDYQNHHPEMILKIERMRAADIEALTLQVIWELRSAGYSELWRHVLGSERGDMAMLYSRFLERDPASLYDGRALLVAFKQWYADEDRINMIDRVALEICDDILMSSDQRRVFANQSIATEDLAQLFALPEGRPYLNEMLNDVLKNPYYASMHNQINEAHLYHIIRDLEVCYVGNVPFRDPVLADKIFPDYTKTLK
tara:strand:+ start:97469 stop:98662 length:1194 start_codon:yes stop_codon:yes gene_type:complete